ncbi:MAG: molecular chaperone DnaJ [Candidatus Pelagibacter sp. TMED153]|nr:MAG: molecular chaperone DnaJ [Candidatus Pelagibacter sp. TMED153]|tara:strand:- start:495 stop:1004 length:510 start_codon:yes stop_codon:yes gene_type:complete
MNLVLIGIIIFVIVYLFLNWFTKTSSKKIAITIKKIIVYLSLLIAAIFTIGGKYLFSLPFLFVILSGLKIKGFTALQMFQLWRLIQFLKNSGRFSQGQFNQAQGSSNLSNDEAYKLLGLSKGCTKEEVLAAANKLQKKIHPDMNRDVKTERLSQIVNEAKEKIIRTDFI